MATTVQSILREHFERFASTHPLSAEQRQAAECLRDCRTPAMGGHLYGCPHGHVRKLCCGRDRILVHDNTLRRPTQALVPRVPWDVKSTVGRIDDKKILS